jgi:hypothetical protein
MIVISNPSSPLSGGGGGGAPRGGMGISGGRAPHGKRGWGSSKPGCWVQDAVQPVSANVMVKPPCAVSDVVPPCVGAHIATSAGVRFRGLVSGRRSRFRDPRVPMLGGSSSVVNILPFFFLERCTSDLRSSGDIISPSASGSAPTAFRRTAGAGVGASAGIP